MNLDDELDVLLASEVKSGASICTMSSILNSLPEDQRIKLEALISAEIVPAPKIAEVLNKHGFIIKHKSIARHRRRFRGGGCLCP
jgi:hypothetical protein